MKNTFNVKIVIFLILIIISLISLTSVFLFDLAPFAGKDQVFIPLIIAMIFTLIRFYNNLVEKSKIVENMKKQKEDSINQTTIKFNTCPEYWTKTTKGDTVYCRNVFTDRDGETMVIGGKLVKVSTPHSELTTNDSASNIGFEEFLRSDTTTSTTTFDHLENTYLPELRSNLQLPETKNTVVEQFSQSTDDLSETTPHIHKGTSIVYTPTNSEVKWADGVDREHDKDMLKDFKHFDMYDYQYVHDHTTDNYYNLNFQKYNRDTYSFEPMKSNPDGSYILPKTSRSMYSNDTNWISPYEHNDDLYAEINLNELNKASNKCELVKNFPWIEAKSKCENVNVRFEN